MTADSKTTPSSTNIEGEGLSPFGFAVLRTPLLPFHELTDWAAGLEVPKVGEEPEAVAAALKRDRERLRERLRAFLERPEVAEALFVASPSFVRGLEAWRRAPDSKKGRRAEDALVRYLTRMASRSTPFGLFSGCSVVGIGEQSRLCLAPLSRYRRRSRLDMDYLFRLREDLSRDPELRRALRYRPNSSLYRAAGRLRYAEAQVQGERRSYHLVAVDPDPFVELVLREARDGAAIADLVRMLVEADPDGEVTAEEAETFLHELIDNQLLVSDLALVLTGAEALESLVAGLRQAGAPTALTDRLEGVGEALRFLDRAGLGNASGRYREIATALEELPTAVKLPRLFQVDMIKPAPGATVGSDVLAELQRGVALLARLGSRGGADEQLEEFRQAFVERYGDDREIPLVEALDEECGVGFERSRGSDVAPLLIGLDFPEAPSSPRVSWGATEQRLALLLGRALERGDVELELSESDLAGVPEAEAAPLSDAIEVMATVASSSPEALEKGDFHVLLRGVFGPSAARLMSRFCHADPELEDRVRELAAAEMSLRPDVVFAEVVHLPEGRIGNIVSRPVLRGWEIPFLGQSGAPEERQIPISDLLVSVTGGEIVLRSARLGRRILPRLTTAHNFSSRGLGVYRFLGALQMQGERAALSWQWGPLEAFSFLPRVTAGRLVLCRARWALDGGELETLKTRDGAARYAAVREWRRRRRVPRRVVLPDGDHELVVDLENPLSLDAFLELVKDRPRVAVMELFPAPEELCAEGPEGRFTHELLVPFLRRPEAVAGAARPSAPPRIASRAPAVRRGFAPGSEWLYARLYTGTATADRVLLHVVPRVVPQALASGAADGWFFLRYGDPDWHLRLRLHGDSGRLWSEVLPALEDAVAPLLDDGQVWKMELGTYEREVERYGGPVGVVLAERLFRADSEAVLAVLDLLDGDASADVVWRLALAGLDRLVSDLGLEGEAAVGVLERMHASFAREHRADGRLKKQMSERLRREQADLEHLLAAGEDPSHPFAPALAAFRRRSRAAAPVVAELRAAAAAGRLTLPVEHLAPSYAHMFLNRLLRSNARAQELVLYDFLLRLTRSRLLRTRVAAGSPS